MKRKMFWFSQADEEALESVKEKYGFSTDVQALRWALRIASTSNIDVTTTKRSSIDGRQDDTVRH
jgi:hypothetical protein